MSCHYQVDLHAASTITRMQVISTGECLDALDEYAGNERNLVVNQTEQDAIILNPSSIYNEPAKRQSIWPCIMVSRRKLGVPRDSRDAFSLLHAAGFPSEDLATRMQRKVGFRNMAVHEYTRPNLEIVQAIITKRLDDFRSFSATIVKVCV